MRFEDLAIGPDPQVPLDVFQKRREEVAEALLEDQILVVATHPVTTYSNDVEHVFRPHSDFWYLTGFAEPGAVLVLEKSGRTTLFMRPRDAKAEVWTGRRLGLERADVLGMDHAEDIATFPEAIKVLAAGCDVLSITDHDPMRHEAIQNIPGEAESGAGLLASMRTYKDATEIRMLKEAARIGNEAMQDALDLAKPGAYEYELEASLLATYKRAGSTGPGYPPIVGAGANAAILHYIENRAQIQDGDLVLVDAGCEWGYYNSDITRTVIAGEPTALQTELHALVEAAQRQAIAQVQVGNPFRAPHDKAVEVLVDGLVDQGLLEGDKDKIIEEQSFRSYYMHGTSHLLGLDVHDVGQVRGKEGAERPLRPGMCLTVEPGVYFNPDFAPCPEKAAGIGIRLENDIIVTEDGPLDLQSSLPTSLQW